MGSSLTGFTITFAAYSTIVLGGAYNIVWELAPKFILDLQSYVITALFYFLVVLFAHRTITGSVDGNPQKFVRNFMAATALKLFLYFGVLIIWVLVDSENAAAIIVSIVIMYFFNTIFDTFYLLKHFKKSTKKAV
ncbi:MAG: hypothetical protein COB85_04020 [Bacteroidetes bacterium]|nr:MAG: hypothetical protein COB85_04020 [Bacteroidota bacterium]